MLNDALSGAIVFGSKNFDPPLWTIAIEFIGSLYLLAYYAVKPPGRDALALILVAVLLWVKYPDSSLFVIAMFAGSYFGKVPLPKKVLPLAAILGVYFGGFHEGGALYDFLPRVAGWDRLMFYNAVGALCLVGAVVNGFGAAFLGSRQLQYFGRISYSIYLVHFLVLGSLACQLYLLLPRGIIWLGLIFVAYAGVALLVAHYFERWVDRNAIAVSRKFSDFLFRKKPAAAAPPG